MPDRGRANTQGRATGMVRSVAAMLVALLALGGTSAKADPLGREVIAEMNLARTDPGVYAGFLRDFRRQIQGKQFRLPGTNTFVQTVEGQRAVDEAIDFLTRQPVLPPLAWADGLAAAAVELALEQGASGATGHTGRKSGTMRSRIERHGGWKSEIAENIGYGPGEARAMVMQFIINDGVPGRGHRKNIFHRGFGTAGAACGPHPRYGTMCVIDFADGFRETPNSFKADREPADEKKVL